MLCCRLKRQRRWSPMHPSVSTTLSASTLLICALLQSTVVVDGVQTGTFIRGAPNTNNNSQMDRIRQRFRHATKEARTLQGVVYTGNREYEREIGLELPSSPTHVTSWMTGSQDEVQTQANQILLEESQMLRQAQSSEATSSTSVQTAAELASQLLDEMTVQDSARVETKQELETELEALAEQQSKQWHEWLAQQQQATQLESSSQNMLQTQSGAKPNVGVKVPPKPFIPKMPIWFDMDDACATVLLEWAGIEKGKCEMMFALNPMMLYKCGETRMKLSAFKGLLSGILKAGWMKSVGKKEPKMTREGKKTPVVKGGPPPLYSCAGDLCKGCDMPGPIFTQVERAKWAAQFVVWDVLPKICKPKQCS